MEKNEGEEVREEKMVKNGKGGKIVNPTIFLFVTFSF